MSLKLKMTLWYTLLMIAIVGLVLGFMAYMADAAREAAAKNTLQNVLAENKKNLRYQEGKLRYWDGEQWQTDIPTYDGGVYLVVYNEDGEFLSGSWRVALPSPSLTYDSFGTMPTSEGDVYYFDMFVDETFPCASGEACGEPSSAETGASGELLWSASDEIYRPGVWLRGVMPAENAASMFRMVFVALPLLVLLAALGGWFLAKKALAPVGKITASARAVSGGEDLSRRIDVEPGKDEIHELAETINGMLDRLEKSFLAERQFTSDASHELRTPTAVILAECDTARKTAATLEEFCQSLTVIERQGRKMSSLIGTLLAYTRREQGTERPEWEELDLSALTQAVCREQGGVNHRNIDLAEDIQPGVTVMADTSLMLSLIQNLVSNAYKYGREGGHIWVSLRREENTTVLRVKDDGIGIAPEKQELVWNRFYQVDPARSNGNGSLGLGLAMAKQIARLHGGDISLTSAEGQGSEFVFTMPVKK